MFIYSILILYLYFFIKKKGFLHQNQFCDKIINTRGRLYDLSRPLAKEFEKINH